MKKKNMSRIILALAVVGMACAGGVRATAQGAAEKEDNGSQMRSLYAQLALAMSGGEKYDPTSDTFVCIRSMGIPISQGFSQKDPESQFLLSLQFDYIPEINHYYHSSLLKYSDVYKKVLTQKKTPTYKENPEDIKQIAAIKKSLAGKMKQYNRLVLAIANAKNAYSLALAGRTSAIRDVQSLNKLDEVDTSGMKPMAAMAYRKDLAAMRKDQTAETGAAASAVRLTFGALAKANNDYAAFQGDAVKAQIEKLTELSNANGLAKWKDWQDDFAAAKVGETRDQYEILFFPQPSEWNPPHSDQGVFDPDPWPKSAYARLPNPDGTPGVAPSAKEAAAVEASSNSTGSTPGASTPAASSGGGDSAPADGSGDSAPADASGDSAPADASGGAAPADASGDAAPADGSGDAAPADGSATPGPVDPSATSLAVVDLNGSGTGGAGPTSLGLSWTHFNFTAIDESNSTHASSESESMSGGYSAIFYSVSGSHSDSSAVQQAMNKVHDVKVSVELASVSVFRPWLDMTVFLDTSWWFNDLAKNDQISYGLDLTPAAFARNPENAKARKNRNPALMPLFYNQIILARNLVIKAKSMEDHSQAIQTASQSQVSGGYFGMNMSGSKVTSSHDTSSSKKGFTTTISVKGVQVIGYICTIVPTSPKGHP